ncbi:DUF1778 domain-containing protein [Sorangium cellulosum]|jgi:uncharacterized protein (DUF1778 family)|uniref:type II toxin-antitoxin system TacA family antitoxin n=1 Tax=Sorangium cellulosum TaxID=56 RepID=UPI003D9A50A2
MAAGGSARAERIELRATVEEKQLLTAAATYERTDVTTFVMRKVLPVAREIVEREEGMKLSERDTQRVLELLDNPPKPTPRLLKAARAKLRAR